RPLSTHTAPSPVAMSVGAPLVGTLRITSSVAGSILATVPESVFATQTDPSAHVSAPGAAPAVEIEASSVALVGSTLPTAAGATEVGAAGACPIRAIARAVIRASATAATTSQGRNRPRTAGCGAG